MGRKERGRLFWLWRMAGGLESQPVVGERREGSRKRKGKKGEKEGGKRKEGEEGGEGRRRGRKEKI